MEYVTPARVLKPKRRPPVSPSAACDTCRAYYRADTRLDAEYAGIIRNLPAELQSRKAEMTRLRATAAMWDQPVKDTVSPDIVRNHLLRRQRVTALLHEGFCEERRGVERCVQTYNKAVDHQRCLASQKLPYRPPRTSKKSGDAAAAAADAEAKAAAAAAAAAQRLDGDYYSDVESEVSGPMIDDGDDGGGFRRRWFHQEPQGAWSTEGTGPGGAADGGPRINMVDAAEVCAKRICNERLKRLQAEGNLLAAQLREELVASRAAAAAGSAGGDVRPARRPVSQASRQRAAEELLSEHVPGDRSPPAPCSPGTPVPPSAAAAQGSSPHRLLGDSRFWSAATRAQAMPDPAAALSASGVATSPRLRSALLSSPHAPVMSAASPRMAARSFLKEGRVPGLAEEAATAAAEAEAAKKRPESIVREPPTPLPARLGAQGAGTGTRSGTGGAGSGGSGGGGGGGGGVRTVVLPVHPLAGAAARLSAAQRQINEGMSLN